MVPRLAAVSWFPQKRSSKLAEFEESTAASKMMKSVLEQNPVPPPAPLLPGRKVDVESPVKLKARAPEVVRVHGVMHNDVAIC